MDGAGIIVSSPVEPPSRVRIFALAWSPDGTRLATATAQGKLRLWHLPTLAAELSRRRLGRMSVVASE
jgi:WD40 repeat protein